tara:strand:- start:2243 stop:2719 length:477 start_codon:yes stop_codon:yes gene_type:complete
MLKDDERYAPILHEKEIVTSMDLSLFLESLDFVIEAWRQSVEAFHLDFADDYAEEAMMAVMQCKMVLSLSEVAGYGGEEGATYIEILKTLKEVKYPFKKMANAYGKTPMLCIWYESLPVKLTKGYSEVHRQYIKIKAKRDMYAKPHDMYQHRQREAFK